MRFYAEYNIMEIDEDNYSYALVGSNTSDYLWLLSRTPTLPEEAILFLLTKAKERGYNTSMLKWVKQKHEKSKIISSNFAISIENIQLMANLLL